MFDLTTTLGYLTESASSFQSAWGCVTASAKEKSSLKLTASRRGSGIDLERSTATASETQFVSGMKWR